MVDTTRWYLQLDRYTSDQVLETRLYEALAAVTGAAGSFLDQLAEGSATPGGGSAAAYAGAMAAALVTMAARLTAGKKKYAAVESRMHEIIEESEGIRRELSSAVSEDARAFDDVMRATRLPRGTPVEEASRAEAVERATHQAAAVPLSVAGQAASLVELAAELAEIGNVNVASDAASAQAALRAAALNVKVNASAVSDRAAAESWLSQLDSLEARASSAESRLERALRERAGIEL
jgi:glutamate formiminotransferase/formiminotetrahydrofolate cyclodeaminase